MSLKTEKSILKEASHECSCGKHKKESFKEDIQQKKKILVENSYNDFLVNRGTEINKALKQIREMQKVLQSEVVTEESDLYEKLEKKLQPYDEMNSREVMRWIDRSDMRIEAGDIANLGAEISNRFGTEMQMVLQCIDDAHTTFMREGLINSPEDLEENKQTTVNESLSSMEWKKDFVIGDEVKLTGSLSDKEATGKIVKLTNNDIWLDGNRGPFGSLSWYAEKVEDLKENKQPIKKVLKENSAESFKANLLKKSLDSLHGIYKTMTGKELVAKNEPEAINQIMSVFTNSSGQDKQSYLAYFSENKQPIKMNTKQKIERIKFLVESIEKQSGKKVMFKEAEEDEIIASPVIATAPGVVDAPLTSPVLKNIIPAPAIKEIETYLETTLGEIGMSVDVFQSNKRGISRAEGGVFLDLVAKTKRIEFLSKQCGRIYQFLSNCITIQKFDAKLLGLILAQKQEDNGAI